MYVFVGLGNPGKRFENTRHNLGFITIDQLSEAWNIPVKRSRFQALIGEGPVHGEKILLAKPQTYMNLSGQSVRQLVSYFQVEPDHLVVIYDDLDLATGQVRIRKRGSAGSHRGMQSVIGSLGFDDFPRIRIGIGAQGDQEICSYVTGGFTKAEVAPLEEAVTNVVKACDLILTQGIDAAMNQYNSNRTRKESEQE